MSAAFELIGSPDADILIVADHASNHVPADIDLGLDRAVMDTHIALDIGTAGVAQHLVKEWACAAILAGVSRLVVDYNREPDAPGLVPLESDGVAIPGNVGCDITDRLDRYYAPYHAQVAAVTGIGHRPFILNLHSFTPCLATRPEEARPWEIGVLYNDDDRAPRIAIPWLAAMGLNVGDQLPYSGRQLNATMNRHAEAHGRPYLGVEIRQDMIGDPLGQRRFADILGRLLWHLRNSLA